MADGDIPSGSGDFPPVPDVSDGDILEAMRDIPGYLDITPSDLKEVYRLAFRHALERISRSVSAADIMTRVVYHVRTSTPLRDVAGIMAEKKISGVPVLDEQHRVAGVISEKDFLRHMAGAETAHVMGIIAACLAGKACAAMPVRRKQAADIMSSPAIVVHEDTPVFEIMELFPAKGINRVPVVSREGRLSGIVSRADIIRAQALRNRPGP